MPPKNPPEVPLSLQFCRVLGMRPPESPCKKCSEKRACYERLKWELELIDRRLAWWKVFHRHNLEKEFGKENAFMLKEFF